MKKMMLVGILLAGLMGCDENRVTIAVSPTGAVRTPEAAREAVRMVKAQRPDALIEVVFADGVYRFERPLALTAEDSGTSLAPVVWRAKNRGKAVFTAATPLTWRPLADGKVRALLPEAARDKVVVADVPGSGPLPSFLNGSHYSSPSNDIPVEIFAGDERLVCARGPNEGFHRTGESDLGRPGVGNRAARGGSFAFDPARLAVWAKEPFPWTFGLWGVYWADLRAPLDHIDVAKGRIHLDDKAYVLFGLDEDMPFYVFNAFCELDRPGEWVVDRKRRRLYLWPEEGKGNGAEVVVVAGLVRAKGVKDVVFDGLVFEKSRLAAVELKDCTNVTMRACAVRHTCSWGIDVKGGCRCRVAGCDLEDLGEGGIRLDGGDHKTLTRADHVAENNRIGHYGKVFFNYRQGVSLLGVGNSAVHNLVHHSPHTAIYGMGNDHYIGWNVIHDTCEFNDDAGAIYVWNYSFVRRGLLIEHNVVHMTGKKVNPSNTEGIYLDDYSPENVVRYNLINRASLGIHLAGGQCNETYGNVLMNCDRAIALSTRATWPNSKMGRKSRNFTELDADLATYSSELWRGHYPGLGKLLDWTGDPVEAHHAFWNVVSNNVWAYSADASHACWDAISNTTVWADNAACGDADPGLRDYFGFDWRAKPGSPHADVIDACGFDRAGLYDSDERLTPAVKFAPDVTPPQPWGPAPKAPASRIARLDCILRGKRPEGCPSFAVDLKNCDVPDWSKGGRVDKIVKCRPDAGSSWRKVEYSWTAAADCSFALEVMGPFEGNSFVTYDGVTVTGVEDAANLFKDAQPFKANDKNRKISRTLRCKKGARVTVSFRARGEK